MLVLENNSVLSKWYSLGFARLCAPPYYDLSRGVSGEARLNIPAHHSWGTPAHAARPTRAHTTRTHVPACTHTCPHTYRIPYHACRHMHKLHTNDPQNRPHFHPLSIQTLIVEVPDLSISWSYIDFSPKPTPRPPMCSEIIK